MELFYSAGGNNRPTFRYQFKMKAITDKMFDWCSNYEDEGRNFRRWHIIWNVNEGQGDREEVPMIQFEWEEPAITFALMFGEYIL